MALNPNHTFEDLGEVKCSIIEKNCTPDRVAFLEQLLAHNGFAVVVVKSPPPKAAKPAPAKPVVASVDGAAAEAATPPVTAEPALPAPPDTYTVGVTDLTFSPVNGVLNRELVTQNGAVVTVAYWKQEQAIPKFEEWYWDKRTSK